MSVLRDHRVSAHLRPCPLGGRERHRPRRLCGVALCEGHAACGDRRRREADLCDTGSENPPAGSEWRCTSIRTDAVGSRPLLSDTGGGGGSNWPPGILADPPTHPHQKIFPQEKNEIYQRGPNLEVDIGTQTFFWPLTHPPPPPPRYSINQPLSKGLVRSILAHNTCRGRCQAGDGMQPMHAIARLLLHANTSHTPSGTHMWQEKFPAGVGRCQENVRQVLARLTQVLGTCRQASQDVPVGVISRYGRVLNFIHSASQSKALWYVMRGASFGLLKWVRCCWLWRWAAAPPPDVEEDAAYRTDSGHSATYGVAHGGPSHGLKCRSEGAQRQDRRPRCSRTRQKDTPGLNNGPARHPRATDPRPTLGSGSVRKGVQADTCAAFNTAFCASSCWANCIISRFIRSFWLSNSSKCLSLLQNMWDVVNQVTGRDGKPRGVLRLKP